MPQDDLGIGSSGAVRVQPARASTAKPLAPRGLRQAAGRKTLSHLGPTISRAALPLKALLVLGATPLQMRVLAAGAGLPVFGHRAGCWRVDRSLAPPARPDWV